MNSFGLSPALRRIIIEAFILCVLSATVGLSLNFQLIFNAFSGKSVVVPTVSPVVDNATVADENVVTNALPFPVELDELDELLATGALLVDARSIHAYQQEHLAGAVSLPYTGENIDLDAFKQQVDFEQTLIAYCSGYGCIDSFDLGVILLREGYVDVLVYEGGVPEWRDAGRPLAGEGK